MWWIHKVTAEQVILCHHNNNNLPYYNDLFRNKSLFPFCNHLNYPSTTGYGCTADRLATSYCGLAQYVSALPTEYQVLSEID